jgi:ATP-dependent protease HslVU (ClpYQ) ATPase subunit
MRAGEGEGMQAAEVREQGGSTCQYVVDKEHVLERLGDLLQRQDLSRYIL